MKKESKLVTYVAGSVKNSTGHGDCQKVHADIRKHGGGMRRLLKQ